MSVGRPLGQMKQYDFCLDFIASRGSLLKCTICKPSKRGPNNQEWKTAQNMKRHVSTTIHELALNEARVRSVSTDMRPPLPPPCAPWARIRPAYSEPHLSSPTCTLNAPHTDTDTDTGSGSGSGSGSDFEIGLSAHARARKRTRGLRGEQVTHTLSAADDICLEQDPNLDASAIQNEDIDGILASILNEDVLRDFNETPVWEPGPDDIAPSAPLVDSNTRPWPDKTHYHTHVLFRSPEHRFSRSQQRAILHWAKLCGMECVPSIHSLDKCDELLRECVGNPTQQFTSSSGNMYYLNSVSSAIQQDMSNPEVREKMEFYPTDGEGEVSEIWDGEKLANGLSPEQLTPMVSVGESHYFVNEFCELDDGIFFIPEMFVRRQGVIWARGYDVECRQVGGSILLSVSDVRVLRPTSSFRSNCVDICGDNMDLFIYDAASTRYQSFLPHPLRQKAQGRPVYSLPFIVFQDDVSGNRTKQFNKHNVCYMTNAALPRVEYNKTSNIRFVGSSTTCTPLEMMEGLTTMFKETFEEPVLVFDAATEAEALILAYIVLISADNPMHADHSCSTGLQSNFPCRVCGYGGTQAARKTDAGFAKVVEPGMIRDPKDTLAAIRSQYSSAFTHTAESYLTNIQRVNGVKDPAAQPILKWIQIRGKELQETSQPDGSKLEPSDLAKILHAEMEQQGRQMWVNPLLELPGFNVHLDTPIEILHTVLLGAVKYFWRYTCKIFDETSKMDTFRVRFNSLSLSGLEMGTQSVPEYICRYRGSLTGRHFRFVVQLIVFAAYDLISPEVLRVLLTLGRVTVLLWYTRIPNMDSYTAELSDAISDFLHSVALVDPRTLIQKTKLHILTHAPLFARRFGPLLGPDSERYESFNSVFRMCSVLSNRSAPSLDTATKMAEMDAVRHVATGGWWYDSLTQRFCRAGSTILNHFKHNKKDFAVLGISSKTRAIPGSTKVLAKPKHFHSKTWADALALYAPCPSTELEDQLLNSAENVIACHGNVVSEGSDVIYRDGETLRLGRVVRIAAVIGTNDTFTIINPFEWHRELDPLLQMPVVMRLHTFKAINSQNIQCHINLQHQCWVMQCDSTALRTVRQERSNTLLTQPTTNHKDTVHYVVNTQSMTSALLIRDLVWSNCVPPRLFFPASTREQARHAGVLLLQAQTNEKNQKKASAAERLLAADPPENVATGSSATHISGRGGKSGGGRGRIASRLHTPGPLANPGAPYQALTQGPDASGAGNHQRHNNPNPIYANNQPIAPIPPEGWQVAWSPIDERHYFYHREKNMSTWEYPE